MFNYIYTGEIAIDFENVQPLLYASDYLEINGIRDACAQYLKTRYNLNYISFCHSITKILFYRINANNVLEIKTFLSFFHYPKVNEAAETFIEKHFFNVVKSSEFLNLNCNELVNLLKKDQLNVPNEEIIFEACIEWIRSNKCRLVLLPHILQYVRFPLMDEHYLVECVMQEELIAASQRQEILGKVKEFNLLPSDMQNRRRRRNYEMGTICIIGGEDIYGRELQTIEKFNEIENQWIMEDTCLPSL